MVTRESTEQIQGIFLCVRPVLLTALLSSGETFPFDYYLCFIWLALRKRNRFYDFKIVVNWQWLARRLLIAVGEDIVIQAWTGCLGAKICLLLAMWICTSPSSSVAFCSFLSSLQISKGRKGVGEGEEISTPINSKMLENREHWVK